MSVLVIGSGPSGLSISYELKKLNIKYILVDESGMVGGAYKSIYSKLVLSSPKIYTVLNGLDYENKGEYVNVETYYQYLQDYAKKFSILPEKCKVLKVEKKDEKFQVEIAKQDETKVEYFEYVIVCTGFYQNPFLPKIKTDNSISFLHSKDWKGIEKDHKKYLVIGGATSAIEISEELAKNDLDVTVVCRNQLSISNQRIFGYDQHDFVYLFDYIPNIFVKGYCNSRPTLPGTDLGFNQMKKKNKIKLIENCEVKEIKNGVIYTSKDNISDIDRIIFCTGYTFQSNFLPKDVERTESISSHPLTNFNGESQSLKNLFLLGTPCSFGVWSEFLRGIPNDSEKISKIIQERIG